MLDPIITNSLMTFGAGFATAAFSKAKGPGQALDDLMTLVGFDKLHEVAERKLAKRELNMQLYKDSIAQKIVAIPEENLKDPPLSIVGPALEASKYYIEDEELREMFAELISGSMDISKEDIIHNSYVEVIKQLTSLDAENLVCISKDSGCPIAEIRKVYTNGKYEGNYKISSTNLFISNPNELNQIKLGSSLENLRRLGLATISYSERKVEQYFYDDFKSLGEFHSASEEIEHENSFYKNVREGTNGASIEGDSTVLFNHIVTGPEIIPGIIRLTPFGKNFCATCL